MFVLTPKRFWRSFPITVATPLVLLALFSLQPNCSSTDKKDEAPSLPRVSIMTFNVENLFDTEHDPGTEDFTFLPKKLKQQAEIKKGCDSNSSDYRRAECRDTDWNDDILTKKLTRIAATIGQINEGRGPDILILVEVENQKVLNRLNNDFLKASQYQTAQLIDGFDPRGIDPAILSRYPMWREPKIHRLPLKAKDSSGEYAATKTRGVLEVPVTLPDGTKALVFAVHLPSQSNPAYLREQAVQFLNQLESEIPLDVVAIAAGDFNITKEEDQNLGLFKTILAKEWSVSHLDGCKGCDGTHYYNPKTEWSFLDAVLVRKVSAETTGWRLDPGSVRVPNESKFQVSRFGGPARFDADSPFGVSDHWPVYAEIIKQPVAPAEVPKPAQ